MKIGIKFRGNPVNTEQHVNVHKVNKKECYKGYWKQNGQSWSIHHRDPYDVHDFWVSKVERKFWPSVDINVLLSSNAMWISDLFILPPSNKFEAARPFIKRSHAPPIQHHQKLNYDWQDDIGDDHSLNYCVSSLGKPQHSKVSSRAMEKVKWVYALLLEVCSH